MSEATPFYLWTITEAWQWMIDVPVLGFAAMILTGIYLCVRVFIFMAWIDAVS